MFREVINLYLHQLRHALLMFSVDEGTLITGDKQNNLPINTANKVNCVAGGGSDPVAFSTTAAPFGTLTLELARKLKVKADDVDPSLGIRSLGDVFHFKIGKISGFFYLICDKSLIY